MKTPENVPDIIVGNKTPEEIKKGLECCVAKVKGLTVKDCDVDCPYFPEGVFCKNALHGDTIRIIHQLESRLAQAERERDAAVECLKNIDQILIKHVSTIVETANKVLLIQKVIADYVLSARRAVRARSKKEGEIK